MAAAPLFVSYSRADMEEIDWLKRLRMYLAPFQRQEAIEVWDDGRIVPGADWRGEIAGALNRAQAAVLLVGPGFLASDFVMTREVPQLLDAARSRGVALFPLVVGYCSYDSSLLQGYQAFNAPGKPLEHLERAEQNRILNDLAIAIGKRARQDELAAAPRQPAASLRSAVLAIQRHLNDAHVAFQAQVRRRNHLVAAIEERLQFRNELQYEKFFFRYYSQLTDEERFEFEQIRAMTEGPLQLGNRRALETIEANPALLDVGPQLTALRQHLVFWLNKFDRVFTTNRAMCLLYTGVEDGVPYPAGVDAVIEDWLSKNA
jgi:hypothetical protein